MRKFANQSRAEAAEFARWSTLLLMDLWEKRGMPSAIFQKYAWVATNVCESPIEQKMLAVLLMTPFEIYSDVNTILTQEEFERGIRLDGDCALVVPQAKVPGLNYRLDFLVVMNGRALDTKDEPMFAVECDGHEFHERTKEQAARDRKRDRDIQAAGIPILRFTGSEIFNNLDACQDEIESFGLKLLSKKYSA